VSKLSEIEEKEQMELDRQATIKLSNTIKENFYSKLDELHKEYLSEMDEDNLILRSDEVRKVFKYLKDKLA